MVVREKVGKMYKQKVKFRETTERNTLEVDPQAAAAPRTASRHDTHFVAGLISRFA